MGGVGSIDEEELNHWSAAALVTKDGWTDVKELLNMQADLWHAPAIYNISNAPGGRFLVVKETETFMTTRKQCLIMKYV